MPTIVENREILIDNPDLNKSKEQHNVANNKKMNKSMSTGSILAINGTANSSNLSDIISHDAASLTTARSNKDLSNNNESELDARSDRLDDKSSMSTSTTSAGVSSGITVKWPKSLESTLIAIHRFLKENNIYKSLSVDPDLSTKYHFRTVYLARLTPFGYHYNASHTNTNEFGFNLQTYGLLNSLTRQTEYICFVNNVQAKSAAKRAGLTNGDVLIAVDGRSIDSFKQFNEIVKHVKGKQELCLTLLPESSCRRIQCELRKSQLEKDLEAKRAKLSQLIAQQDEILGKYQFYKDFVAQHQHQQEIMQSSLASTNSFSSSSSGVSTSNKLASYSADPLDSGFISPISNALIFDTTSNQSDFSSSMASNTKNPVVAIKNYYSTPIENSSTETAPTSTIPFDDASSIQDSAYVSGNNQDESSATNTSSSSPVMDIRSGDNNHSDLTPHYSNVSSSVSTTSLTPSDMKCSSLIASAISSGHIVETGLKSSSSSSQLVKQPKSSSNNIAKKCLEKTNRLIRSASTSSMNLISKLSSSGSSTQNLDTLDTNEFKPASVADDDQGSKLSDESTKPKILNALPLPSKNNSYIVKVNNTKSSNHSGFFAKKRMGSVSTNTSATSGSSASLFSKLNDKSKSNAGRKMSEADIKSQKKQMFSILSSRPKIASSSKQAIVAMEMTQPMERSHSLAPDLVEIKSTLWTGDDEYLNSMLESKQMGDDELNNSSMLTASSTTSSFLNASSKSLSVSQTRQTGDDLVNMLRRPTSMTERSSETVIDDKNTPTDEFVVTRL